VSKTLLVVHHTPSPYMQEMLEAVLAGATDPEINGVEVSAAPRSRFHRPTCWGPMVTCSARRRISVT
jgi:hypothetical protein